MSRASTRSYLSTPDEVGVAGARAGDPAAAELARLGGLVAPSRLPSWPSRGWGSAWRRASRASRRRGRRTATRCGRARSSSARRGRSPASGGARSRSTHSAADRQPGGQPLDEGDEGLAVRFAGGGESQVHGGLGREGATAGDGNERARPAPGSFPSWCSDRPRVRLLLRGAVVGDPGRDQDNEVAPVFLYPC